MRTPAPEPRSSSSAGPISARSPPLPTTSATGVPRSLNRANSATLGISSTGMLSMTNQPRSSSESPNWVRPAPDTPVITTNSLTRLTLPVSRSDRAIYTEHRHPR